MQNINVLVFPCGSEIGLEIHRALSYTKFISLYGGSSTSSNYGRVVYKNYIEGMPFIDDPGFIDKLNTVIDEYKIDFIFPAHDSVVLRLAEQAKKIRCKIVSSGVETCQISRSKAKTYETLADYVEVPSVYKYPGELKEFPVFLKPDVGQGSKGVHLAHTLEEVYFFTKRDPSLMILEYLPGKEYTVDCFTDRNGHLKFCGTRERSRVSNGISVNSKVIEDDEEFRVFAEKINSVLKFRGMWFFQVKRNNKGHLSLLEIAPRVAGTMGYFRNLGVNLPLLSIYDLLDYEISINANKGYSLELDRALTNGFISDLYYENVYIDFDDTLICNGKVNTMLVAFIFQCLNEGKRIYLITRHINEIHNSLVSYKLQYLFDKVIHLKNREPKSDYIEPHLSIVIDDSFAERTEIASKLGIPTFDLDALESLIDLRR